MEESSRTQLRKRKAESNVRLEDAIPSDPADSDVADSLTIGNDLVSSLLNNAVSDGTIRQYSNSYKKWTLFCQQNGLPEFPAKPEHVASCVALVAYDTNSVSAAETLASAIAFEHRKNFLPSPTVHESFKLLMRSIRKRFSRERHAAEPITRSILDKMLNLLFSPEHGRDGQLATLTMWRTIWRVAMEFHTLGRFSDLTKLLVEDLRFFENPQPHLRITFKNGKNDLFSEGSERIVSSNIHAPTYCPVRLTRLYLVRLGPNYRGLLSPRCLGGARNKGQLPDPIRPLSYATSLQDLRDILTILGYDASLFAEHSGKRGGATTAAASGMDSQTLQRMGGWRSQQMAAKYTDMDLQKRLEMSSVLNKRPI
jgi:hypothetical protein